MTPEMIGVIVAIATLAGSTLLTFITLIRSMTKSDVEKEMKLLSLKDKIDGLKHDVDAAKEKLFEIDQKVLLKMEALGLQIAKIEGFLQAQKKEH